MPAQQARLMLGRRTQAAVHVKRPRVAGPPVACGSFGQPAACPKLCTCAGTNRNSSAPRL
eukprot:5438069-Prymnesium_polylepis.1